MKNFLLTLAVLLLGVSAWAAPAAAPQQGQLPEVIIKGGDKS